MPQDIEKANIITARVTIAPNEKPLFIEWQARLQDVIAKFPGFLSLEILAPNENQSCWTIIQRFSDDSKANAWKESAEHQVLFNELRPIQKENVEEFFSDEKAFKGVTEVIVTEVAPEKKNFYRQWLAKIHQAEANVPGFRGMYVQAPATEQGRFWITFLQFDSTENMDKWLASAERQEVLKGLDPLIKSFESHRIISPYAGWFGSIEKNGAVPSVWKQTMLILLVLFPIVMLEFKFLNPFTRSLTLSVAMFIGNAISVTLVSYPFLPIAISCFRWWLVPQPWNLTKINVKGTLILLALYLLEVIFFFYFI